MRSARIGRVAIALLLSLAACQQAAQPGDPSLQPAVESSATPIDRTVALHFAPTASGEMASIAIQRLAAIDAGANELAGFELGAAAPGAIELDGWSDPTTGSDGGRYRFADGNADLRFEAPPGTEGLLLEARTNRPQSWQQISFNGRPITVRLTNGWRQLYLPLGAAAARGPGDQQPAWRWNKAASLTVCSRCVGPCGQRWLNSPAGGRGDSSDLRGQHYLSSES